jgi:hypothetical protein
VAFQRRTPLRFRTTNTLFKVEEALRNRIGIPLAHRLPTTLRVAQMKANQNGSPSLMGLLLNNLCSGTPTSLLCVHLALGKAVRANQVQKVDLGPFAAAGLSPDRHVVIETDRQRPSSRRKVLTRWISDERRETRALVASTSAVRSDKIAEWQTSLSIPCP